MSDLSCQESQQDSTEKVMVLVADVPLMAPPTQLRFRSLFCFSDLLSFPVTYHYCCKRHLNYKLKLFRSGCHFFFFTNLQSCF